jgi:hypothetical protein
MDYYDRLLGGMLASLLLGIVVGLVPDIGFHRGLLSGALVATLFFWQAVFRNPPVPDRRRVAGVAVVWHGGLLLYLVSL